MMNSNPSGQATLAGVIAAHAQFKPDGVAFIAGDDTMTWVQYCDWSTMLAGVFISCGIDKGERIAILLPDGCETHVAYVACEKAGVVGMAIAARAGEKEIVHLVNVSGAIALITLERHNNKDTDILFAELKQKSPQLRHHIVIKDTLDRPEALIIDEKQVTTEITENVLDLIAERHAGLEDLFLLNSTSGTTGMPKCVTQNQWRWFEYAKLAQDTAELSANDVFLRAVPASVGFGLWTGHFLPTLLGATTIVLPKFSVEAVLAAIERHRGTVLVAVSTQFIMLLNHPDLYQTDLSSLRLMYTGGEAVPYDRAAKFEEVTGASVLQFYGSNETGALSYTTVRDSREKRLTTAGKIIPSMHVKLINEQEEDITASGRGQPVCKGPVACMGYFNNKEANKKLYTHDGYMKMEDLVTIDEEGYLKVIGRIGDFIIRGGKNISAVAVEDAVIMHPDVHMVAAVAMPDPVFGEKVCVYLTLRTDRTLTVSDLAGFLEANGISKEYFPEKIVIVDELPTVSGGKIAKHVLREDIRQRLSAEMQGATV